jgi:uncharacterized membrane protein
VLAIAIACAAIMVVSPPLQAPDEPSHLSRAYLLAHGQWMLDAKPDGRTGGEIDSGLLSFMSAWSPLIRKPGVKVTAEMRAKAAAARWMGTRSFRSFRATSLYAPIMYAPLAIGLRTGEVLGLPVSTSYYMARILMLASVCAVLLGAFHLARPPAGALAVLALPMSLFQMSAPVIDGLAMALSALAVSLFIRMLRERDRPARRLAVLLAVVTVIVVTGRPQAVPLLMLAPLAYWLTRHVIVLWTGILAIAVTAAWMTFAVTTSHPLRPDDAPSLSTSEIVSGYVRDPASLLEVVSNTVTAGPWILAQGRSFIGVLGALDTPLSSAAYSTLAVLLCAALAMSPSWRAVRSAPTATIGLACCGMGSAAAVLLTLLIFFTPHPAESIRGVQGRYFLIPALILAYSAADMRPAPVRSRQGLRDLVSWTVLVMSASTALYALSARYYD